MANKIRPAKGFQDFTGKDAEKKEIIRKTIVNVFETYGFEPAETPVIEYENFVKDDNSQDEVISDVFKLKDKGKRKLALRYEFTFQLKRLSKEKKLPYKRYQIGEVFRDEPISSNRFRQFTQCDADIVGSTIKDEAEILSLTKEILDRLKIKPIILINNRKLMNEILEEQKILRNNRDQVLREIDKYDKIGEKEVKKNLRRLGGEKIIDLLKQGEKYFKKFDSYKEILKLIEYCKMYGFKVSFDPTMVRGLSYYNGSVFEVKAKGIKETIAAGGSYSIEKQNATGISFGLERISVLAKSEVKKEKNLVISLNQDKEAIKLIKKLRKKGHVVSVYYGKPSKALEWANSYNYSKAIFVGEREVKKGKFKVKDLASGKESNLDL
ncbi:MAG: ATP phosphoribosyltransferase regulatory subunit [Candidatus Pacearchaeota archaeon]